MHDYFCGWYFKCQSQAHTLALIPAVHASGGARSSSIQLISEGESWTVPLSRGRQLVRRDRPYAALDGNLFCGAGIHLNLETDTLCASGSLRFGPPSPIRYDIMGPFRYVPFMECRHSIYSMRHSVNGRLAINGTDYSFDGGVGYIEGDSGRSFPRHYVWTQCSFPGGALMLSAAEIPLGPVHFTGIIGVVQLDGTEYRLATYLGARAVQIGDGQITVRQGSLTLTAALLERNVHPLCAPASGAMTRTIREGVSCRARYQLTEHRRTVLALEARSAAFEYEYP